VSGSKRFWVGTSWKMNKTLAEAGVFADAITAAERPDAELFVIPPHTAIFTVAQRLQGTGVRVGAQDGHWEDAGAFTGTVSAALVKDAGAEMLEIGHSERRQSFGETDATVNLKAKAALRNALLPLICIGDTREERDAGAAAETVIRQARLAIRVCLARRSRRVSSPTSPSGRSARAGRPPRQRSSRRCIRRCTGPLQENPPAGILYGGSVSLQNAAELATLDVVDGLFVGRAGWQPESFLELASAAARSRQASRRH
jgi:triosephosphate isomerase